MDVLAALPVAAPLLALAVPTLLLFFALIAPRRARLASASALGCGVVMTATAAALPATTVGGALPVRVDVPTCVMLLLVAGLSVVVVRYSERQLRGDPGIERYLGWMLGTLSAVSALVVADDLLLVGLAWTATSLALHRLLVFFPERDAAQLAARKKFLVSRLADVCFVACVALVHGSVGSLRLDDIAAWVAAQPTLPLSMHAASLFLVAAVILRSAQLPFHGWLTQVMEAPTAVSALLHAGVVNVGGFVLLRLAPWIDRAPLAQAALLTVGLVSVVAAALVTTTRVSVKVALAWSTGAQMGFMLVQCALGLWSLALLHLVAHSLYKAYAFLGAGSTVDTWRSGQLASTRPSMRRRTVVVGLVVTASCAIAFERWSRSPDDVAGALFTLLVGLSVVPLGWSADGARALAETIVRALAVMGLYAGAHLVSAQWTAALAVPQRGVAFAIVAAAMLLLFALKSTLELWPNGRVARTLHPWLFSGFYLDEHFTRLTYRLSPSLAAKVPAPPVDAQACDVHAR